MSPLGIVTCTMELPSDAAADGANEVVTLELIGCDDAQPHKIKKAEVRDVVG